MGTLATAARILSGQVPLQSRAVGSEVIATSSVLGGYGGGLIFGSGGVQLSLGAGERSFAAMAVAYRCVAHIAQNLASLDMVVMAGDEADDTDPMAVLWNQGTPDSPYSARVVREVLFARAELQGQAFGYIDRDGNPNGPAAALHPIYDPVEVVVASVEDRANGRLIPRVLGYVVKARGGDVPLLPSEVLWMRYPHPTERWGALAPWKAALYAAESDALARKWQRSMLEQDARPSMIVNAGSVPADRWEQLSAQWVSRVQGPGNAGRSLLVSSATPVDAKPLTFSPAEMAYLESRKVNADEVMLAFGIRRDVLFGESTYENQRAAKTALWSDTLLPKLDTMASELDRQLMPDPLRTVAWDLSEVDALRESQDSIIKRVSDATYPDVLMIDEGRAMMGLDPLPNGLGQMTLTAYREHVRATAQMTLIQAQADALRSAPAPRYVRTRGRTRMVKVARPDTRAAQSAAKALAAYDRLERIGQRALARLAARQEQTVMRELNKLRSDRYAPKLDRWAQIIAAGGWPTQPLEVHGARTTVNVARIPEGQRAAVDDLFDAPYWTEETVRALEDFMTATWMEGGQEAASAFGVDWDVLDPRVMEAMAERLRVLSGQVTDTTRSILESQILEGGLEAGESIDDLAARLRTVFTDLSTWRAALIARTEVVGGYNAASHRVAAESGVVATRRWLAAGDGRVRPSHRAQDGHTLARLEERYPNGCLYPGDPAADPSETVNCRCVELFDVTPADD